MLDIVQSHSLVNFLSLYLFVNDVQCTPTQDLKIPLITTSPLHDADSITAVWLRLVLQQYCIYYELQPSQLDGSDSKARRNCYKISDQQPNHHES